MTNKGDEPAFPNVVILPPEPLGEMQRKLAGLPAAPVMQVVLHSGISIRLWLAAHAPWSMERTATILQSIPELAARYEGNSDRLFDCDARLRLEWADAVLKAEEETK